MKRRFWKEFYEIKSSLVLLMLIIRRCCRNFEIWRLEFDKKNKSLTLAGILKQNLEVIQNYFQTLTTPEKLQTNIVNPLVCVDRNFVSCCYYCEHFKLPKLNNSCVTNSFHVGLQVRKEIFFEYSNLSLKHLSERCSGTLFIE